MISFIMFFRLEYKEVSHYNNSMKSFIGRPKHLHCHLASFSYMCLSNDTDPGCVCYLWSSMISITSISAQHTHGLDNLKLQFYGSLWTLIVLAALGYRSLPSNCATCSCLLTTTDFILSTFHVSSNSSWIFWNQTCLIKGVWHLSL